MTSFWDIVFGGDLTSVALWCVLFGMLPVSLISGITSIICSAIRKTARYPFSFKLLTAFLVVTIILGALLTTFAMTSTVEGLLAESGAGKQSMLAMNISVALYGSGFALLFALPYLFFIAISLTILHFKQPKSVIEE